ncbi:MAG: glutathione peroxidase [Blastocatellia bacterium]
MLILKILAVVVILAIAAIAIAAYSFGFIFNPSPTTPVNEKSIYEFTMKNIDGADVKLDAYKGKVTMIVNVASKCGLTTQYQGLQALYDKHKDKGFVVLGFPANNFLGQEPGTEKEIKDFCTLKYNVTFPMFSKLSVRGTDQHPFYTFLTHKQSNPGFDGDITWNFEKFVADRSGKIIARFSPTTTPDDPKITETIEAALAVK